MNNEVINSSIPLVRSIAKNFYNVEQEDLIQAGLLGLINAYKHYKKNSNTKFSTFAYSYIFGEMYNLSIKNNPLKYNKEALKVVKLIDKAKVYLTQSLNKEPSISDISKYLNIDENIIENIIISMQATVSLDKDNSLYNSINYIQDKDTLIDLKNNLSTLSKEERSILLYRYYKDMTQNEIAKKLDMSQVSVSRYEQKTLKKLKKIMVYE